MAATLRKIGVNAELAPSDWSGILERRANRGPAVSGGWSIFITGATVGNPIAAAFLTADGEKGWYGWPKSYEYEALRAKWDDVETLEERKALARELQRVWWNLAGFVFLGQSVSPIARRKTLAGLIDTPLVDAIAMWNMQKD